MCVFVGINLKEKLFLCIIFQLPNKLQVWLLKSNPHLKLLQQTQELSLYFQYKNKSISMKNKKYLRLSKQIHANVLFFFINLQQTKKGKCKPNIKLFRLRKFTPLKFSPIQHSTFKIFYLSIYIGIFKMKTTNVWK